MHRLHRHMSRLIIFIISLTLTACGGMVSDSLDADVSVFKGSIGDGPIIDANVLIYDKNNNLIKSLSGYDNATYFTRIKTRRTNYPVSFFVNDGFDLVTESEPDFTLLSVTLNRSVKDTNINPFSTMVVKVALAASGQLNEDTIGAATSTVISQMNFGLDVQRVPHPMTTKIGSHNVAVITKSSEAMGEMIRRVRDNMVAQDNEIDGDAVVSSLADDLIDGSLDGIGSHLTNPRMTALAKLVSAQVLVESLINQIHVNGQIATSKIDMAIRETHPGVNSEQLTDYVRINGEMLDQTLRNLVAAYKLRPSHELKELINSVRLIPIGSYPFEIESLIPEINSEILQNVIDYSLIATEEEIETVNKSNETQLDENSSPQLYGSPANSVLENNYYVFNPGVIDPDGDVLEFFITNKPIWATFDYKSGRLSGTPESNNVGVYKDIVISVTDGFATDSIGPFSITVDDVNVAPTISGAPITAINENEHYNFQPSSSDQDGDNLIFSITNQPAWASFDSNSGQLSGTPSFGDGGVYDNIVIAVTDGLLTTALSPFGIQVNADQAHPEKGSFTVSWDAPEFRTDNTSLPKDEIQNYRVSYGTESGKYTESVTVSSQNQSATVSGLASNTYYVVATTIDTEGRESSYSDEIIVTVNNDNTSPVITGVPVENVEESNLYNFEPLATDADGDNLVFNITGKPAWANFDSISGKLWGTPSANDVGIHNNIQISVNDGSLSASLPVFSITVNAAQIENNPPAISGVPSGSVSEGGLYEFYPDAFDEDGDNLTFNIVNLPGWASFDISTGSLSGTPTKNDEGVYDNIVISVTDGLLTTALSPFSIQVNADQVHPENGSFTVSWDAPEFRTDNTSLPEDEIQSYRVSYGIESGNFTDSVTVNSQNQSVTVSGLASNTYYVVATTIDTEGRESSYSDEIIVTVNNDNTSPVITGVPLGNVEENNLYSFEPSATDAEEDSLVFSIIGKPAWANFDTIGGKLWGTPSANDIGIYSNIIISVSDGQVSSSIGPFSIIVSNINEAPEITGSPSTSVEENNLYSFTPSANDPDGDNISFSIIGKPDWASFDSSTGQLSGTPVNGDEGIYDNIVILVSDGFLTTVLPAFSIQVYPQEISSNNGSFTLSWDVPTSRVDNTELLSSEIESYVIYFGTTPGIYTELTEVSDSLQSLNINDFEKGIYYFVITTKDTAGSESSYSNTITVEI